MGFLRRLFGQPSAPASVPSNWPGATRQIAVKGVTFNELRDDAAVDVVGEQYHGEAVRLFRSLSSGSGQKAVLMPEPDNRHDANAIGVYVWTAEGEVALVGYLARETAVLYHPIFEYLGGKVILCEAALAPGRGGGGTDGVVLHLGTPGELIAEAWADDHPFRPDHAWAGKKVVFSGFGALLSGVLLDREGQLLLARLAGCVALPRVTKKVEACITANPNEATTNVTKARDYGIPIILERDFWLETGIDEAALGKSRGRWAQTVRTGWASGRD